MTWNFCGFPTKAGPNSPKLLPEQRNASNGKRGNVFELESKAALAVSTKAFAQSGL